MFLAVLALRCDGNEQRGQRSTEGFGRWTHVEVVLASYNMRIMWRPWCSDSGYEDAASR